MITNTANKVIYDGDGITKQFIVSFPFDSVNELQLYIHNIASNIDEELLNNWSYNQETNEVTYPVNGIAIPNTKQLVILRETPLTQEKNHEIRLFTSEDIETIADKLTREVQDVNEKINRAVKYPASYTGSVDAGEFLEEIKGYAEDASAAHEYAQTASQAAQQAILDAATAGAAAADATDKAQIASEAAQDVQEVAENINSWMETLEHLKDGDIKTYTAGTSTDTYDGSLTVFPVENEFAVPVNVYVNGQFKEINTEYTENKTDNIITFTTALNTGDKVNIVSNLAMASLDSLSTVVANAISTHNSSLLAHNTLISDLQTNKLENSATGTNAVTVLGTASAGTQATNVGKTATAVNYGASYGYGAAAGGVASVAVGTNASAGTYATAIGSTHDTATARTVASGDNSIAVGHNAKATATNAIQIGEGTNATANTVQIKGTTLFDANNKIPTGLLPSNLLDNTYQREFTPLDVTIATGNAGIAGAYTITQLPDDNKIRIALFQASLVTSQVGYSSMNLVTDVSTTPAVVCGTNNGFAANSTIMLPIKRSVTINFPSTTGGVIAGTELKILGYF